MTPLSFRSLAWWCAVVLFSGHDIVVVPTVTVVRGLLLESEARCLDVGGEGENDSVFSDFGEGEGLKSSVEMTTQFPDVAEELIKGDAGLKKDDFSVLGSQNGAGERMEGDDALITTMRIELDEVKVGSVGEGGGGPIVDVAEHVGYPAGALGAHDNDLDGKVEGSGGSLVEVPAPTMLAGKTSDGRRDRSPSFQKASLCGAKPEALASSDERVEATDRRVALRSGRPVATTSAKLVDSVGVEVGGEAVHTASSGGSKGIGLDLEWAIRAVSPVTALSGERHPAVISSPRTLHKNFNSESEANLMNCPVFFAPGLWSYKGGNDGFFAAGRTTSAAPSVELRWNAKYLVLG
ncbi:hypothetical protein VNO80_02405 [Phaseolus coccineus]|uniref:Uncharacterized protein n=1 Tax=Phaseolus coccineus TaxID=3886 RepID=A0AAN9RHY5_PHACN